MIMKRNDREEKFVKVLRHYSEAIGERPTGELHPDLQNDQDDYDKSASTDIAMNFLDDLESKVVDLIGTELESYLNNEKEPGALEVALDIKQSEDPSTSSLYDFVYEVLRSIG